MTPGRPLQIDGRALLHRLAGTPDRRLTLILALGALLRLFAYFQDPHPWMDESSLRLAILARHPLDVSTPMHGGQMAPAGFVAAEWLLAKSLGTGIQVLRLLPLAAGLASLAAFGLLARRLLPSPAAEIAAGLFAFSASLVHYSCEMKPYIFDVLVSASAASFAIGLLRDESTPRKRWLALPLGALAPWFSFTSAFVLPVASIAWLVAAWREGGARRRALPLLAAVVWGLSVLGSVLVASRVRGPSQIMDVFWAFAFLPIPPRTPTEAADLLRHALNLFSDSVRVATLLGPQLSAILGLASVVAGALLLARRRQYGTLFLLLGPLLLHLAASSAGRFPFHGRVALYQSPLLYPLCALGFSAALRLLPRPSLRVALIALIFSTPTLEFLSRLERPPLRPSDPHGDLRPDPFPTRAIRQSAAMAPGLPSSPSLR